MDGDTQKKTGAEKEGVEDDFTLLGGSVSYFTVYFTKNSKLEEDLTGFGADSLVSRERKRKRKCVD